MSEFTKGPWRQQGELTIDSSGQRTMRYEVYSASGAFAHPATAYSLADARLIAAAPEMFELLERWLAVVTCSHAQPMHGPADCLTCLVREIHARIVQFGPHAHAGVWISRETADQISSDGA